MTLIERVAVSAEHRALRERMLLAGMTRTDIAGEFIRRYGFRPRAAFRHAHGWTQVQAADHINGYAAHLGLDPESKAPLSGPILCTMENWPYPTRRRQLTPHLLALLALVYRTDVHSLLDEHDGAQLRPIDRLVIESMVCIGHRAGCLHPPPPRAGGSDATPATAVARRAGVDRGSSGHAVSPVRSRPAGHSARTPDRDHV